MSRIYFLFFLLGLYLLLDFYVFNIVKSLMTESSALNKRIVFSFYWIFSALALAGVLLYNQIDPQEYKGVRMLITSVFFINIVSKLFSSLVILGEDFRRLVVYIGGFFGDSQPNVMPGRKEFMGKAALIAGAVPLTTFSFGIISGAHDYRIRRKTLGFKDLPRQFDGIRIAQISDIHTGSFFNKTAVKGGVDMLLDQKPDLVFFTGDLVNNQSDEAKPYLDIFKSVKAPLGVYSTMGNHDYGDYNSWSSQKEKMDDIKQLHEMHKYMGWDILLNENRQLSVDGESISVLGVENWGAGRFSKYGDLQKTVKGTEETPFKILLSHDPTHWDAEVRPNNPDIDLTLSGHTHGMQFGVEFGNFKWSPSQYIYKRWADLYKEGEQYLYVNRGYGYIGYPGRVGILPEITILELKRV